MLYREFGKTGLQVSAIGLGCWNISNQWATLDDATAEAIVRASYDEGVTLFDNAESYGIPTGLGEIRLGKALRGIRDKVCIVTKTGWWGARTGQKVPRTTPDMIRLCGHASLGRLRTDYIDVLLCHDHAIEDPSIYIEGFEALRKEGFVREYGISTDNLDVLKKFHECSGGRCAAVEVEYSLLVRDAEAEFLPWCQANGIAVLARGPWAQGLLSGRFNRETVFEDSVRKAWNPGQPGRAEFERRLAMVEKLQAEHGPDCNLGEESLRYVTAHASHPVAIPGATSVEQAIRNARSIDPS